MPRLAVSLLVVSGKLLLQFASDAFSPETSVAKGPIAIHPKKGHHRGIGRQ